ncbi:DNA-binding transcriptional MerR regulator [Methylobacterium sp. RAS18]|nr:DNA-binding transcriptional MerR regulator [Methylobacterium sp. RAS18]
MPHDLLTPRFSQPSVLQITRLKPSVLQTWVNRGAIELADQNPGYGKRRLYSALDVVKLGLMRRISDLRMELSIAREIAGEAERLLRERGTVPWNLYLSFNPTDATQAVAGVNAVASAGFSSLGLKYDEVEGDACNMSVAQFTERFDELFPRRKRTLTSDRPIDPSRRDALARRGIHAEPAVIFPFGEIVNGTLAQLATLTPESFGEDK